MLLAEAVQGAAAASQPPFNWSAIIVQTLVTVGIILGPGGWIVSRLSKKVDKVQGDTAVIRDETRNAHAPERPMRHDIDTLLQMSADNSRDISILLERSDTHTRGMGRVERDIGGVRAELRALHDTDRGLNAKVDTLRDDYHKHVQWANEVVQRLDEPKKEKK